MKYIAVILIAGIFMLKNSQAKISRLTEKKASVVKPQNKRIKENEILERLLQNNKRLNDLLQQRGDGPVIWEQNAKLLTGKTFRARLLNTIVSTNLASPVLVMPYPGQGLPLKTKFSCQGVTQNKRVFTLCNRMITPEGEKSISAQILNIDGSSGLEGIYDDGKESLIAGSVISDFAQGMLSAAQTRISGPFGAISDSSGRNQILEGAINSGRTTSEILLDEMKRMEPVVIVEAGSDVLVYFMEAYNEG
jgi:hypothetical protein